MAHDQTQGTSALKRPDRYTVQDYQSWDDGERWELIHGEAFAMSPAPTPYHQGMAGKLYQLLANYLEGKPCQPFVAPVDGTILAYRREGQRFGHLQEYRPDEEVPSQAITGFVMPARKVGALRGRRAPAQERTAATACRRGEPDRGSPDAG